MDNIRRLLFIANDGETGDVDYSKEYFTIEALEDDLIASLSKNACEYRIDDGSWNTLSASSNTPSINKGQTLSFRGDLIPTSSDGIGTFNISKKCNVKGNIMSLLYGDDFIDKNDLNGKDYAFYQLFYNCNNIVDVSELLLLSTTLARYCYFNMFYGCTSLTIAPQLPATTLATACYCNMFQKCTSLTIAPELPATTLASSCYNGMFLGCTSLTTAPALPATTLAFYCYEYMFKDCTNLTSAPALPVKTLAERCYSHMFSGCTSLTSAPELPATTLAETCYFYMFSGCTSLVEVPQLNATTLASSCYNCMFMECTSLTTAPALPATTLASNCYYSMFYGCISLVEAPQLNATTLTYNCYSHMFYGCSKLNTAPQLPATTLVSYCYEFMFKGCSKLNYIKMLAKDISAGYCLNSWVSGVASSGTFVKHHDMTSLPTGTSGIPNGWTVEDYVEKIDYSKEYFTIEALEDGLTVQLTESTSEYCIDNGEWISLSSNTETPPINSGQKISFKITNPIILMGVGTFTVNKAFNVEGNIMSLLYGDDFIGQNDLSGYYFAFYQLFQRCATLQNAENLILPATTLANDCYSYMFFDCTSLTTAPELPATTLTSNCYYYMFNSCRKLNYIKMLATDISAWSCLDNWVYGVASSGTFVKHSQMTSLPSGTSGIPNGWTVEDHISPGHGGGSGD